MVLKELLVLTVVTVICHAGQKCTMHNGVRMHNGKRCASTTNYIDHNKGACGCGTGNSQFAWNHDHLVVAASENLFDPNNGKLTWCGGSCGKCVKLTPTGGYIDNRGQAPENLKAHTFMITNLCPPWSPNQDWCAQKGRPGGSGIKPNKYGYEAHFDLENGAGQAKHIGWDNPEVTWEFVSCTGQESKTPSYNLWHKCECA